MLEQNLLRPVVRTRLSDQAYEALRDSILRRELLPGRRLDLDDLHQRLVVSRTPLKEAINRLATEGLVTVVPRRGSYVTELTPEGVAERFDARQVLEIGAVDQIVANLTEEHVDHLRQLYAEWHSLITPDGAISDYFRFLDKDREFHRSTIFVTGNHLLLEVYDGLNLNLQMAVVFYPMQDRRLDAVDQEHRQILESLEARDKRALKSAIRNHIQGSKRALIAAIGAEDRNGMDE